MSEDVFGEELAPDATIWKLYVEEATEQDQELANLQNKNIDLMLLFAALFSAILTAFLVEAKDMLEEDPAATSAALLLLVVQSQQRLELGTPNPNLTVTENILFVPTTMARYVNGLWFTALALSLAAALIAMLAKEWLAGFVSSTVRPPYDYALQRQAKYNGLLSWRALYIVALLPSLLHLSLLLFAIGLILYLWTLDEAIAVLICAVAGATLLLYLTTAILGAVFESCPFVTYMSAYIRTAYTALLGDRGIFKNKISSPKLFHHDGVPNEALQALGWLAANSRDPAVANSAYQALAAYTGLSQSPISSSITVDLTNLADKTGPVGQTDSCRSGLSHSEAVTNAKFLQNICRQFKETLLHRHREVAACFGTNLARYAVALPSLATHMEAFRESKLSRAGASSQNNWNTGQNYFELAFATMDLVWNNDCVPLSADTYAILTAAELRLTASVTSLDVLNPYGANSPLNAVQRPEAHQIVTLGLSGIGTNFSPARYSRTLARASVLLHYHLTSQAPISATVLSHLLNAISSIIECERVIFISDLEVKVNVVGGRTEHCPDVNRLGDPNGIFRRLLKIWDMEMMPGSWSRLEHAAAKVVSSFAHHFLKEWMGRNEIQGPQSRSRSSSYRGIDFELPITLQEESDKVAFYLALENWPDDKQPLEAREPSPSVLSRLLVISVVSICQMERQDELVELPGLTLRALYRGAEALSGQRQLYAVITKHKALVRRLIHLVENNAEALKSSSSEHSAFTYMTRFLALPFEKRTLMAYCGLQPQEMGALLKIMGRTSDLSLEVELILYDVVQLLQDRPGAYIPLFIDSDTALLALLDIGRHDTYAAAVTNTLHDVLRYLTTTSQERLIKLTVPGPWGILAAVDFVCKNKSSNEEAGQADALVSDILMFLQGTVDSAWWDGFGSDFVMPHLGDWRPDQRAIGAALSLSQSPSWCAAGLPRMSGLEQSMKRGSP